MAAMTYFVKVSSAPLRRMFASVAIEDCEETLSTDRIEINNERMGILHSPPRSLILGNSDLVSRVFRGVAVEDLGGMKKKPDQ